MSKPGFWFCKRCKIVVIDQQCDCATSPSPWEWVGPSNPLFSPPWNGLLAWAAMAGTFSAIALFVGWLNG